MNRLELARKAAALPLAVFFEDGIYWVEHKNQPIYLTSRSIHATTFYCVMRDRLMGQG